MKIILPAVGTAGDHLPIAGIGKVLAERGHDVLMIGHPRFSHLASPNLRWTSLNPKNDYLEYANRAEYWSARNGWRVFAEQAVIPSIKPLLDIIREEHVAGRTVCAATCWVLGARLARDVFDMPLATLLNQPSVLRSLHDNTRQSQHSLFHLLPKPLKKLAHRAADAFLLDPLFLRTLKPLALEHGIAPPRRIYSNWWFSPDKIILLFPEWYAPRQKDWPRQTFHAGFPLYDGAEKARLPQTLEDFLSRSSKKPLVFTMGSAAGFAKHFYSESAKAAKHLGRPAIFMGSMLDSLPAGADLFKISFLPYSLLLPRCAALVHHGGIGTISQSIAAGIPQIAVPLSHDQPDNAARVQQLGFGSSIPWKSYSAKKIIEALNHVLTDTNISAKCQEYEGRKDPCLENAASQIESLLLAKT